MAESRDVDHTLRPGATCNPDARDLRSLNGTSNIFGFFRGFFKIFGVFGTDCMLETGQTPDFLFWRWKLHLSGKISLSHFTHSHLFSKIESVLFNLHRFMLATHSPVFRTLFELPPPLSQPCDCGKKLRAEGEQEIPEGSDDHHPIVLNGIMVADMEPFLTILYMP
jgi:hypothetical protein